MTVLARKVSLAEGRRYDLIVVGGGIYGTMLLLEACRAGMKCLLLEKADFGSGASANNLRIVHGGLRYLQTLHFSRMRDSITERRWFLQNFPDLVRPLECLMPLYGGLLKNRFVLSAAMQLNDWLSADRNKAVSATHWLPGGTTIGSDQTIRAFPLVRPDGLRGAARWFDAAMPDCQRIQMEILRWAAAVDGNALNYCEVTEVMLHKGRVSGVRAIDIESRRPVEFLADQVINAAGPDVDKLPAAAAAEQPELFRPSIAWNLLLDRPPLAAGAVAVHAPGERSHVYFSHALGKRMFVGTGHAPLGSGDETNPSRENIDVMLDDLNRAVPALELERQDIVRVFSGLMPVSRSGTVQLADKPQLVRHGSAGGPDGLYSVSGVKYTTARKVAADAIAAVTGSMRRSARARPGGLPDRPAPSLYELHPDVCPDADERMRRMKILVETEAPTNIEDLLFRRSNLISDPVAALEVAKECVVAFKWDNARADAELRSFEERLATSMHSESASHRER